ncbi:MAG: Uma2 family endonuclease [Hyphomicrobiaceae bacterium]
MAEPAFKYPPDGFYEMTAKEFLNRPDDTDGTKYELVDGQLRAMSPAGARHGAIQATMALVFGNHLAATGAKCVVVNEPIVEVRVRANYNRRAPDLGVTCSPITGDVEIPDPILLIEILSKSNWKQTIDNIWTYTTIPSVQELLIVSSMGVEAQLLRRQKDGAWPADLMRIDESDDVTLSSIGLTVPLKAFYAQSGLL